METAVIKFDASMLKVQIDELVRNTNLAIEEERGRIVAQVLAILNTNAEMEIMRAQIAMLVMEYKPLVVMYAQQSQLEEFNRMGSNLLTLSRHRQFPFETKVKVIP